MNPRSYGSFMLLVIALASCGGNETGGPVVSKDPISVRGWILDVEGSQRTSFPETEIARKAQLFQQTYVEVKDAPYVSGGVQDNGSFILLDVPPGNVTITFNAPGAPAAKLILQNIPGNADVVIPALVLGKDSVRLAEPGGVVVRLPGDVLKKVPGTATIAGHAALMMQVPVANMSDRRDFPTPPGMRGSMPRVKGQ